MSHSPLFPWVNNKSLQPDQARSEFYNILRRGLTSNLVTDVDDEEPNLYLAIGYAKEGYRNWNQIKRSLKAWCEENDARHPETGWILLTHGDASYGHKSIESIAQYVKSRGTPVVFIQSSFARTSQFDKYWPTYASAGLFGGGSYNLIDNRNEKAWGGYVKIINNGKPIIYTGKLAYPDDAMINQDFDGMRLVDYLGGLFVAGGGNIARDQCEIYKFMRSNRLGDLYVPAVSLRGMVSNINSIYPTNQAIVEDEVVALEECELLENLETRTVATQTD